MKPAEIRDLNDEQLKRRGHDLREELFKLIVKKQSSQLENPSRLRLLRRDIARVETMLSQRRKTEATR